MRGVVFLKRSSISRFYVSSPPLIRAFVSYRSNHPSVSQVGSLNPHVFQSSLPKDPFTLHVRQ